MIKGDFPYAFYLSKHCVFLLEKRIGGIKAMNTPSSSLQSDATSAPSGQTEPVSQGNPHDSKTVGKKEQAAMQERLNALPMLKVLSIMRKALPGDAHIDAEVDGVIKACIARFSGVLLKETKKQESLSKHKTIQSEDIINALKHLGFEDSSAALSLFLSRFRVGTNHSQPHKEQLPVETTRPLPIDVQRQVNVSVPTGNTYRRNQAGDTHGEANSSSQRQGNATVYPPPSQVITAWHSSYELPFSLQTLQGKTEWDVPFPQAVPNPYTTPCINIFHGYEQQVPMRMMQPQWNTERYVPNIHGYGVQQNSTAYPGYVQMQVISQQRFSEEMAYMDMANALQLIRQYEEQHDMP